MILATREFWGRLLEISFLNLLLSGDNAVVIALAVRALPRRAAAARADLGHAWARSSSASLFVGVVTRAPASPTAPPGRRRCSCSGSPSGWSARSRRRRAASRHGASFWEAIWIIIVADITMSLDNVLAVAAAAHGDMLLVTLGIGMSVPIVVWGSGLLAGLMNRYPWIIWVGGGLLGYVAGDMMLEDPLVAGWLGARRPRAWSILFRGRSPVALTGLGWWWQRSQRRSAGEPA